MNGIASRAYLFFGIKNPTESGGVGVAGQCWLIAKCHLWLMTYSKCFQRGESLFQNVCLFTFEGDADLRMLLRVNRRISFIGRFNIHLPIFESYIPQNEQEYKFQYKLLKVPFHGH